MTNQWTCGGCGDNEWRLTFEDEYPEVILISCIHCGYVDTMYLEEGMV